MFPGTIISRLKQFLTGGGEGKDRKRKPVVPLDNIDAKKARMTNLSSIPASAEEAGHYRSMAGVMQNGAHPYASSVAPTASSGSNVRRLSDLTDISQMNNAYGMDESASFNMLRAEPVSRQSISSRPMAKRSNNGPPMLIPIKASQPAGSYGRNDYLRYSGSHNVARQQNGDVPTLLPLGDQINRPANTIPELTNEFKNLLRAKCNDTLYRTPPDQSSSYISHLDRQVDVQREARRRYEELMKKFIPLPSDSSGRRSLTGVNRRSLNGDIQRPAIRKQTSIETIELTDDEDDDEDDCSEVLIESTNSGQLFVTADTLQLTSPEGGMERERKKPPLEVVNTIKDKFETKQVFRDNIIQDVQQRYGSLFNSRKSLIEQEKERLSRFSKNTVEQEGKMRNKMLNYVCSFYKFEILDEAELEEATKEPQEVPLPALTQAQLDLIHRKLRSGNEVVADKFNLKIRGSDLVTLQGSNWLNDEVINFYMELLRERSELKQDQGLPKVYTMNTFFLPRLLQTGHSGVRRWTRKVDLLAHDMIVVPVHVNGIHWCMSIIDLRRKSIHYYDSMGSPNNAVLNALEGYLCDESLDKRKQTFDTSGFTKANIRDCPRQENGSDCGVFSCMFAEFLTRDHPITFDQSKMQYFRQKMMVEIVTSQLLT